MDFSFPTENKLNSTSDYTLSPFLKPRFGQPYVLHFIQDRGGMKYNVITKSMVSINISAEPSLTFFQCLTALLSELWTFIFIHNYEKWIFWFSFSVSPPGKAHTEI